MNWNPNDLIGRVQEGRDAKIDKFVSDNPDFFYTTVMTNVGRMVVIGDKKIEVNSYINLYKKVILEEKKIDKSLVTNGCYFIAANTVADGFADGVLSSQDDTTEIIGTSNHAVCYKILEDDSVIAIDFTASFTHDNDRENFSTFCLHVSSLEELKQKLSNLHGGVWNIRSKEKVESDLKNPLNTRNH